MSETQRTEESRRAHLERRFAQWAEMFQKIEGEGWDIIPLYENGTPDFIADCGQEEPRLALRPKMENSNGTVIICAGGGFRYKTHHEAYQVAYALVKHNFDPVILDYRVAPHTSEQAIADGFAAIKKVRELREGKVAIMGFSAGGMMAAAAGARYEDEQSRPDACVVCYGAMDFVNAVGGLSYDSASQREKARTSTILNLSPDSPPYFIFQTTADDPRFGLELSMGLARNGIPFELHIFEGGRHGGGLYDGVSEAPDFPRTALWLPMAASWLKDMGF
ncbi:MAG: hypothetical protein E7334_10685 [Clostridiales bacterium]|nr:hypothetical protein [Clostridiales bacterium]